MSRKKSKELLEEAKRKVEEMIQKGGSSKRTISKREKNKKKEIKIKLE